MSGAIEGLRAEVEHLARENERLRAGREVEQGMLRAAVDRLLRLADAAGVPGAVDDPESIEAMIRGVAADNERLRAEVRTLRAENEQLRQHLNRSATLLDLAVDVHGEVVMDTEEDRALQAKVIATFRQGADRIRASALDEGLR